MEELDQVKWDEYFFYGTDVLKNKFNIKNKEDLKQVETIIVKRKLTHLYLMPIKGNFDLEHLKNIHKYIFESIYPFAGEFRTCTMQKTTIFCAPEKLEEVLNATLEDFNKQFDEDMYSIEAFAFKLANFYYELIYSHPFREGNGRTIRAFIRDFVVEKSKKFSFGPLDLDYTKIDGNNLLIGTVKRFLYPSLIEMEFLKGLVKVEDKTNKRSI